MYISFYDRLVGLLTSSDETNLSVSIDTLSIF